MAPSGGNTSAVLTVVAAGLVTAAFALIALVLTSGPPASEPERGASSDALSSPEARSSLPVPPASSSVSVEPSASSAASSSTVASSSALPSSSQAVSSTLPLPERRAALVKRANALLRKHVELQRRAAAASDEQRRALAGEHMELVREMIDCAERLSDLDLRHAALQLLEGVDVSNLPDDLFSAVELPRSALILALWREKKLGGFPNSWRPTRLFARISGQPQARPLGEQAIQVDGRAAWRCTLFGGSPQSPRRLRDGLFELHARVASGRLEVHLRAPDGGVGANVYALRASNQPQRFAFVCRGRLTWISGGPNGWTARPHEAPHDDGLIVIAAPPGTRATFALRNVRFGPQGRLEPKLRAR